MSIEINETDPRNLEKAVLPGSNEIINLDKEAAPAYLTVGQRSHLCLQNCDVHSNFPARNPTENSPNLGVGFLSSEPLSHGYEIRGHFSSRAGPVFRLFSHIGLVPILHLGLFTCQCLGWLHTPVAVDS